MILTSTNYSVNHFLKMFPLILITTSWSRYYLLSLSRQGDCYLERLNSSDKVITWLWAEVQLELRLVWTQSQWFSPMCSIAFLLNYISLFVLMCFPLTHPPRNYVFVNTSNLRRWGKGGFQKYFLGNNTSVQSKWKCSVRTSLEPTLEKKSPALFLWYCDEKNKNSYGSSLAVIFWLWYYPTCKSYQACLFT